MNANLADTPTPSSGHGVTTTTTATTATTPQSLPPPSAPLPPPTPVRNHQDWQRSRRRSQEICVVFTLAALIIAIAAPLAISAQNQQQEQQQDDAYNTNSESQSVWGGRSNFQMQLWQEELLDIASDSQHSCAIRYDATVICWGNQMGVPANLRDVTQIAVGDGFSCAIQQPQRGSLYDYVDEEEDTTDTSFDTTRNKTGQLRCWGDDTYADFVQPADTTTPTMESISFVTASGGTVCVIDSGVAQCWGLFELGRVALTIPSDPLRFLAIPKLGNLRHVCGIRERDDSVQCWTTSMDYVMLDDVPLGVQENSNGILTPMESVAVMDDFACGIAKDDASIHCWAFDDTQPIAGLPDILPPTTYTSIVAGYGNQFCAIQSSGFPICVDHQGQRQEIPREVGYVTKLSIDRGYICAIMNNYMFGVCWGDDDVTSGQLAPFEPQSFYSLQVTTGTRMTCGIHLYDTLVDCWGLRRYQLVVGALQVAVGDEVICVIDASDDLAKCVVGETTFVLDGKVRHIEVSPQDMICTIGKLDATVRCYRVVCESTHNDMDACRGYSNFTENPESQIAATFQRVRAIQLGQQHYCVIEEISNRLHCASFYNSANITSPEAQVPPDLAPVLDVAMGRFFTCAVQENYEIVCWGDTSQYSTPFVLDPPQGTYYQAIAATTYEACAITLDKFVHCWGRPFISAMYVPSQVRFVTDLSGGSHHFCAHKENQEVIC